LEKGVYKWQNAKEQATWKFITKIAMEERFRKDFQNCKGKVN